MSANTLLTSTITGGSNTHTTTAEEANAIATDFVSNGVVGSITLNTGSAGTGSFCVNADASPDMGVTIKAGQAYITATPSSQNSQVLRVRAASDYTAYTINANASGSTKYDWVYLSISATNANNPSADGSNVASFVTSRSSSNSTDNGSPPTYGLLLAVITVANGASSITNSNISDKRYNASTGAQNGSLVVQQSTTGANAKILATGVDANVNLELDPKGTGVLVIPTGTIYGSSSTNATATLSGATPADLTNGSLTITVPSGGRSVLLMVTFFPAGSTANLFEWQIKESTTVLATGRQPLNGTGGWSSTVAGQVTIVAPSAGSHTYKLAGDVASGGGTITTTANFTALIV